MNYEYLIMNNTKKKSALLRERIFLWLGWLDSNQRMQQSKCCVLPLDDIPSFMGISITQTITIVKVTFQYGVENLANFFAKILKKQS